MTKDEKPAFTVINGDKTYHIWASGRVEGFDTEQKLVIINRIPIIEAEAANRA
jgi:hypothetical protein